MISVLVPFYNAQNYILDCFLSILNQTFKDIEIVFVNDCSTDNSREILCKAIREQKQLSADRIVLVDNEQNMGVSYNRNICKDICKGDYFIYIDADDWIEPDAIELLYTKAAHYNADIVSGNFILEDGFPHKIKCSFKDIERMRISSISGYWAVVWKSLYRTDFIKKSDIHFPDGIDGGEDYVFVNKCLLSTDSYFHIEEFLYHYRVVRQGSSIMNSFNLKGLNDQINATRIIESLVNSYANNDYNRALNRRYLYLKKECSKQTIKIWTRWHPQANSYIRKGSNGWKERIFMMIFLYISKLFDR